jgi:P2-related tail formation protein
MRHHVPFSPAVVGRCEEKLLPWEAVDASVETACWSDDDGVAVRASSRI